MLSQAHIFPGYIYFFVYKNTYGISDILVTLLGYIYGYNNSIKGNFMRIRKHLMHIYCHLCQTDLVGSHKLVQMLLTNSVLHFKM